MFGKWNVESNRESTENSFLFIFLINYYGDQKTIATLGKLRQQIVIAVGMVGWCIDVFEYFLIKLSIEHPSILYGHLDNNSSFIDSIYCSSSIQWSPRMRNI